MRLWFMTTILMACVWINMDAADVAFTEAAVGAGISTILLVGTRVLVGSGERKGRAVLKTFRKDAPPPAKSRQGLAFLVMAAIAVVLVYGTWDMPRMGDPESPAIILYSCGEKIFTIILLNIYFDA